MNTQELINDYRRRTKTNLADETDAEVVSRLNVVYTTLFSTLGIHNNHNDINFDFLPVATFDVTSGVRSYRVNSVTDTDADDGTYNVTDINRVWLDGILLSQHPIDVTDGQTTFHRPYAYDRYGHATIVLGDTPTEDKASGLKVEYQRIGKLLDENELSVSPGFNPIYHRVISLYASYEKLDDDESPRAQRMYDMASNLETKLKYSLFAQQQPRIDTPPIGEDYFNNRISGTHENS